MSLNKVQQGLIGDGVAIPPTVAGYRTAVVAEADRLELAIPGAKTVEELIDILNNQDWPSS